MIKQKVQKEAPLGVRMNEDDMALLERVKKVVNRERKKPAGNSKLFKLGLRALAEKYGIEPGF